MLQSSGTIAQTEVSVDTLVRHALMRCGKLPSTIGGELLSNAREALYMLTADLANDGINLWCLQKSILTVLPNQIAYTLPSGVSDVVNCLYRKLLNQDTEWEQADSYVIADLLIPTAPTNLACVFNDAANVNLVIEYTDDVTDDTSWKLALTLSPMSVIKGALLTLDFDVTYLARYWRLRDVDGATINITEPRFRTVRSEIPMAKLNRDDYMNLPNKWTTAQQSLQFWFDKQVFARLQVWPRADQPLDQIVVWAATEIQDPGALTNRLSVPTRWYQAVVDMLAERVALYIPPAELPQGRLAELQTIAAMSRSRASNGESDGSSYQLAPRIGVYTS